MIVHIPGAKRLLVSFDPQTVTEGGCDYVRFYADSAHTSTIPGASEFSGGKDGSTSNWPGLNNRPEFVIDGDIFYVNL